MCVCMYVCMYVRMYVSTYVVEFHKTIVEFRCGAPLDVVELHLLHTSSLLEWSAVVEFPMWKTSGVELVCGAPHWEVVAEVDSTPIVAFLSFYTVHTYIRMHIHVHVHS